jgi:hypothetical protein
MEMVVGTWNVKRHSWSGSVKIDSREREKWIKFSGSRCGQMQQGWHFISRVQYVRRVMNIIN